MVTRRTIARLVAVALFAEVLFPPFDPPVGWKTHPMVHWFLFSPPFIEGTRSYGTVNVWLLALELIATFAIGWLWIQYVAKE